MDRDQRGDIPQHAGGLPDRWLERLIDRGRSACQRALSRVQRRLHRLRAAEGGGKQHLRQQQPGPGLDQLSGQRRKPPLRRHPLAAQVQGCVEVLLDQPGRPGSVPGGQGVPYRVIGQPMLLIPGGGSPVQHRDPAGPLLLQADAEQVGEQAMVTPPAANLIQRHQEQACLLNLLQHGLAIVPAGDRIAQPAAEAFQHRGFQQELAHLLRLAVEHFSGQIVQDVAVAAAEGRHEPGDVGPSPQRQGGQLQAGRPAFGAGHQRRHCCVGQGGPSRFAQQGRPLLGGEPQVVGAKLRQLPAGPQPRQRQRGVGPAG